GRLFYIIFLFVFIFFAYLYSSVADKKSRYLILFIILILFLMIFGLRFDVGSDYYNYVLYYYDVVYGLDYLPRFDYYFFYFFSRFFSELEYGYFYVFLVYSIISILLLFYLLRCVGIVAALYFFITFGYMFIGFDRIRQFLAIIIFLYAARDIVNDRLFSYVLKIFIATFFHVSAIVLIPAYFLCRIKFSNISITLFFVVSLIGFYLK